MLDVHKVQHLLIRNYVLIVRFRYGFEIYGMPGILLKRYNKTLGRWDVPAEDLENVVDYINKYNAYYEMIRLRKSVRYI